tara:strand:- start:132 stop:1886 length:1755 start_codon:yes stop_codon:yes gene_type:complete
MKSYVAIIEKDKCHPTKCNQECVKYDPLNRSGGEGFHIDEETNKAAIAEELVTEMHKISANKCPYQAIKLAKLPEKLDEDPIHKYGNNSFELYSLPIPKKGTILGLIGRNGIGKSTALNILSNSIKPNLGNYNKEPSSEQLLNKYAHTSIANYFFELQQNQLKLSYKPQRVELIPKNLKGPVKQLLNEKAKELLIEIQAEHLINRNIEELSGGELQKIAILTALTKQVDIIYIDEPSSFLDITSRIKVAKLIRELAEDKAIIVVDHDLATLDYICDEIQIVYGERAAYGIFSQAKSVRRGINDYLHGFLPEENLQFRNYKIEFNYSNLERTKGELLFEFPSFHKSYKHFGFLMNQGEIYKGEILGIMGSNGLGKTTFLKILAGEETPDNTKIEKQGISYKKQYLEILEGTVKENLIKIAGSEFSSGWYKQNILEKLGLKHILESEIKNLSGGELQKFHIALTLSKEADLYAFDEPTAFVDVEDRLNVASVIKEFTIKREKASIIVDHDVQFMDYVSDSFLIFQGQPGIKGEVQGPLSKEKGMNILLKSLDITYRRDQETKRARINKPGSQLDQEQRTKNQFYYQ